MQSLKTLNNNIWATDMICCNVSSAVSVSKALIVFQEKDREVYGNK